MNEKTINDKLTQNLSCQFIYLSIQEILFEKVIIK